jgi:hypothetical protein
MGELTITQTLERRSIELNEEAITDIVLTHLASVWNVPKGEICGSLHVIGGYLCAGGFRHEIVRSE